MDSSVPNTTITAAIVASRAPSRRRSSHCRTGGGGPLSSASRARVGGFSSMSAPPATSQQAPTVHIAAVLDACRARTAPTAGPMM